MDEPSPCSLCQLRLNSLRPSDAYMRHWTGQSLVQIMACRLFGFNRNSNIFIQENVFESVVWEMASILSRPQCVNIEETCGFVHLCFACGTKWCLLAGLVPYYFWVHGITDIREHKTPALMFLQLGPSKYISMVFYGLVWAMQTVDWDNRGKKFNHCGLGTSYGDISWSTLARVMACCLPVPSHRLNQCLSNIGLVLWHSLERNVTERGEDISP